MWKSRLREIEKKIEIITGRKKRDSNRKKDIERTRERKKNTDRKTKDWKTQRKREKEICIKRGRYKERVWERYIDRYKG